MRKGYTLVEVLAAVAILGTGLVAMLTMFQVGTRIDKGNEAATLAVWLLQGKVEVIRDGDFAAASPEARAAVPGHPSFETEVDVADDETGAVADENTTLKRVSATIWWTDVVGGESSRSVVALMANRSDG